MDALLQDPADTKIGTVLGLVMRKMHAKGLSDFFVGSVLDLESKEVRLYFSDEVMKDALEGLVGTLAQAKAEVRLERSDEEGAEWMLVASAGESEKADEEPLMTGDEVPVQVSLTGEIPVKTREET